MLLCDVLHGLLTLACLWLWFPPAMIR